ncbi:Uma2 family endonuclease [Tepidibacillus fermentans]|uniref:Uma2 family endonuclease n=1 Tax=Tepidibacillus fermentans TaxID=1281767 RepID=A0A4R3KEN7_9BACI|nr:Uma2 family endonuclease [Tepidibacillus fermentans]TCS81816.1 Uma2 family endonuclease [Tepidibacillus fermentans]
MGKKRHVEDIKEESLTYEDYSKLPEDGSHYELVNGKLELMAPAPTAEHQIISSNLIAMINQHCRLDYFILYAPIDLILSNAEVRQPDIVMIQRNRRDIITRRGIEGAPDLIVEILSPSTALKDKKNKRKTYAYFGIKEYWIVDPLHRTIEQNLLNPEKHQYDLYEVFGGDEETITSPLIPCLSISVKEIFRDLDLFDLG